MAAVVMRTLGSVMLYVHCQTRCIISVSLSSLYDSDMYCMLLTSTRVLHVSLFPDLITLVTVYPKMRSRTSAVAN